MSRTALTLTLSRRSAVISAASEAKGQSAEILLAAGVHDPVVRPQPRGVCFALRALALHIVPSVHRG